MAKGIQLRTILRGLKKNNVELGRNAAYVNEKRQVCATGAVAVTFLGYEKADEVTGHPSRFASNGMTDVFNNMTRSAVAAQTGIEVRKLQALEFGYEGVMCASEEWVKKGKYGRYYRMGKKMKEMAR